MLLSITALGYPSPIFISWGDEEKADPYTQGLATVGGILKYLRKLPEGREDDLVLIVDGYDAWFQLRPDVIISRYYDIIKTQTERLVDRFDRLEGSRVLQEHGVKQSIIFGADKTCWPENPRRPACWAVPQSPLPRWAFGPETDSGKFREHNRPRWLNSGTVIGPVGDLIKLFEATVDRIKNAQSGVFSDQFHISNLFGRQELARYMLNEWSPARLMADPPSLKKEVWISDDYHGGGHFENITLDVPYLDPAEDHEFHMTIDYESQLFQINSYHWKYLDWFAYDHSTYDGRLALPDEINTTTLRNSFDRQLHFDLPEDILASPPPFPSIGERQPPTLRAQDPSRDPRPTGLEPVSYTHLTLPTKRIV